ncbi:Ig domain-containing protein [Solwaraspora sp. WMMD791]|uniref:Ig domain-containing protein n=1 Tax=Solwaraspora sp. WMMD791 TaxID=3016086 RepID=UPI00249A99BD|nr:Ig domain-containing protein [Solwaraspora sp. WMMD791]WFE24991.1 Ig domain-containing protein [Solwaraspora sp. WMMD791]
MAPATRHHRLSTRRLRPARRRRRLFSVLAVTTATLLAGGLAVPQAFAAPGQVRPFVDCIQERPDGTGVYTIYFGYEAGAQQLLEFGDANQVYPGLGYQGQPSVFNVGHYPRVFAAVFNANAFPAVAWSVDGQEAVATLDSPRCAAGLTAPASDVTGTTAVLNGVVTAVGPATTATFEWGPTPGYGQTSPVGPVTGTGVQLVRAELTGLTPLTTYHFRLRITDGTGTTTGARSSFTTPAAPLAVTTESLEPGRVGRWYKSELSATGGEGPYRWRMVAGAGPLPPGLTLNGRTGAIVGHPSRARTFTFTVKVIDANGITATRTLSITTSRQQP